MSKKTKAPGSLPSNAIPADPPVLDPLSFTHMAHGLARGLLARSARDEYLDTGHAIEVLNQIADQAQRTIAAGRALWQPTVYLVEAPGPEIPCPDVVYCQSPEEIAQLLAACERVGRICTYVSQAGDLGSCNVETFLETLAP